MYNLQIDDNRLETVAKSAIVAGDTTVEVKNTTEKERKNNGTIVTEADREAEEIIRERLMDSYEYPILGEEFGGDIEKKDTYWVIDPIDGTHNFANQQPLYGTAIALVKDNEPTLGVFYMPELNYLFYAVKGEGAYRNNERLQVGNQLSVNEAYYSISGIGRTKLHSHVSKINRWVQQLGSAVMAESWIASGWSDVGVFGALGPWDIATGTVLVRESGGIVKSILGENSEDWSNIMEGRIVLGNERLVNNVLDSLSSDTEEIVKEATYNY
jgi:fructose-1,6-bisphosphatase/inositol monophosphatase family enzyme